MKRQSGYIFRKGPSWFLRYSDTVLRDGVSVRVQPCKKLAPYGDEYRTEKSVQPLADEILLPINSGTLDVRSTMTVVTFIETVYLPEVKAKKRRSTFKNYSDIFRIHVRPRLLFEKRHNRQLTLRDFRCCDGEKLLADIGRQACAQHAKPEECLKAQKYSHHERKLLGRNTLTRIKSFLSGAFKTAKRLGALDGINPMTDTSLPEGRRPGTTYAYSPREINQMLEILPEPARTVILLAAYTGLRQGEIRGLQWKNLKGKELSVERSIWNGLPNKPKTACSEAPIPVVRPLREALEAHREETGILALPDFPIFQSGHILDDGTPTAMNLANLAKRIITPRIEKCLRCGRSRLKHRTDGHMFELDKSLQWHGWHAFRRGLATTLHQLGIPDKEIQGILRHSNVAITQASYIKCVAESQVNALDLVAEKMRSDSTCNESATPALGPVN